jgi:lipopolysaccharide heptosyltransferase II
MEQAVQNKYDKILIIRMSSLGDIVLTSPLIRLLRKKFPNSMLDYLIRTEYTELVRYNPNLNRIIEFNPQEGIKGLQKLRKIILTSRYNIIIDVQKNLRSYYLLFGIHCHLINKVKIFRVKKNQFIRFLLVKFKINLYHRFHEKLTPVWKKYVNAVTRLDINPDDGNLELFLPENINNTTIRFDNNLIDITKRVVVAPGARHFTKRWPEENFITLIKAIFKEYGYRTILVGGKSDLPAINNILSKLPNELAVSTAGKLTILETAAIIKHAKLVISNDSGLMHIADAFNKPLIAIFGSTVKEFGFYPQNPNSYIVEVDGLNCRPCSHIGRQKCPRNHFNCMNHILPDHILNMIDKIQLKKIQIVHQLTFRRKK